MYICENWLIHVNLLNTHHVERTMRVAIGSTKVNRILSSLNAFEFKGLTDKVWTRALIISLSTLEWIAIFMVPREPPCATPLGSLALLFFPTRWVWAGLWLALTSRVLQKGCCATSKVRPCFLGTLYCHVKKLWVASWRMRSMYRERPSWQPVHTTRHVSEAMGPRQP